MADMILDWALFGTYGADMNGSHTVNTGGMNVTVDVAGQDEGADAFTTDTPLYIGAGETFDPMSSLKLSGAGGEGGVDNTSTTTLSFNAADPLFTNQVQNVSFRINDIDTGDSGGSAVDIVSVRAYDAAGNPVPVTMSNSGTVQITGSTATGNDPMGSEWYPNSEEGSVLVNIAGPVARIEIDYDNGGASDQYVWVTDVNFSTVDVVDPVNTDPVAVDDEIEVFESEVAGNINGNVLANDTDADSDPLTVSSAGGALPGTVVAGSAGGLFTVNADGTYDFDANGEFENLGVGDTATTTIEYTVDDGNGGTDTATLTVTVQGENDAPVAVDDTASTAPGVPVIVDLLGNDTDADDGAILSFLGTPTSPNGTVVDNGDGTVTFTPAPGFTGPATIEYVVQDENGATDTGLATVSVEGGLDGYVDGTPGDDLIDINYTGDPDGDRIDHGDAILPGQAPEDDIVLAGAGNDTILSGLGDDSVIAGPGNDVVDGGVGNDTIEGGDGNDTVDGGEGDDLIDTGNSAPALDHPTFFGVPVDADPNDDRDLVYGGAGNDTINTGDDADTIYGGTGNDSINSGIDDDLVDGGEGDDFINASLGNDTVYGGDGNDTIITGVDAFSDYVGDDPNLPNALLIDPATGLPALSDPNPNDDRDLVYGGAGNDVIMTGDDADTIYGGSGNDTIHGGIDDDYIEGNDGDDSITGGHGSDTIYGGDGNDWINAGDSELLWGQAPDATDPVPENGRDFVDGGAGNDTIFGQDDEDTLLGGDGDDYIDGGIDDDLIEGGAGNDMLLGGDGDDTIVGGAGNDTIIGGSGANDLLGGDDRDVFIGSGIGDVIDGNEGGDDYDTLDLTNSAPVGGRLNVIYDPNNAENGTVEYFDATDTLLGTSTFVNIENVITPPICFTPGTVIATPKGERLVEELRVGDRIITRDNGIQEICWLGSRALSGRELIQAPHLRPILIQKGALGNDLPERDMMVSPNHRILVNSDVSAYYFDEREVLAAAKHLTDMEGVDAVDTMGTTYIHMMFEQHEVVLSNGSWTESFQPGDLSLKGIKSEQRDEIMELFPELETAQGLEAYSSARRSLKRHEARLLVK